MQNSQQVQVEIRDIKKTKNSLIDRGRQATLEVGMLTTKTKMQNIEQ
jgi:hypothetical protein